jgi:trimethylamine:corrinoid methyltransferase-like protein
MGRLAGTISFLNDEELTIIHKNSLKILHDIGFNIPNRHILEILEDNNCQVDYDKQAVRIDPSLVEKGSFISGKSNNGDTKGIYHHTIPGRK